MDNKEYKDAIASAMKDNKRETLAQIITEFIQPQHITTDFVSLLLNARSLNPGDSLLKKLRKGIRVHTLVPGSMHLANEITVSERMNYILDGASVKVTANEWDLMNGDIGTVDEIKREMSAKLRDFYINKVFTALSSVWTAVNTPSNYTNVGGAITATALKAAIDNINTNGGGVKAIVGTRSALTPITTFGASWSDGAANQIVPENIREIMATGWLGKYYGAPILALQQEYNNPEDYTALLPEDKILVIGNKVGDFVTYGEVRTQEYTDPRPTPPQWFYQIYQQFGLIVDNAQGIHVLKVS